MSGTGDGRERILDVARALFIERGFAEVSMQQIADAAGLRKASIYHHFRDKQALFAQVMLREMQALRRDLERLVAGGGTLREQLERLARAQFGQFRGDVTLRMARDFREHVPEPYHEEIHRELEEFAELYAGIFRQAASAGELRDINLDPRVLGVFYYHLVAAWAFHALEDPGLNLPDPDTAARIVTDLFLHGAGAGAGPRTPDRPDSANLAARVPVS